MYRGRQNDAHQRTSGEAKTAVIAPGRNGVSKTIKWIKKTMAGGSEGGCAYEFVSKGHMVYSPTNSESSLGCHRM